MYPYKIALISQEVFNLSLFIQKLNFTFGRKAYFCYYDAGIENYKDNMRLFYPRQTKLLNKFTRTLIHFLFLFYFFTFHAHVRLKPNSRFTSRKSVYHAITPCITFTRSRQLLCCFTNHDLKKGQ